MARAKKNVPNMEKVERLIIEGFLETISGRDAADFGGHDYAFKVGRASEIFRELAEELELRITED